MLDRAIIEATRKRLAVDGYSNMTIRDIANDAGVSRPTIYRRWATKLDLTIDAVRYGFDQLIENQPLPDLSDIPAREVLVRAVRWINPQTINPDGMVFIGMFMSEALRTPELLRVLSQHGIDPRLRVLEQALVELQGRGDVRGDLDVRTVAGMCMGAYCTEFIRGGVDDHVAETVVATLWPCLSAEPQPCS